MSGVLASYVRRWNWQIECLHQTRELSWHSSLEEKWKPWQQMVESHGNSAESEPKMEGQNLLNSYCLLNAVMSLFCVGAV